MYFDLNNRCKNEFKDNNEKSCSWSRNRVFHKIDFKAVWPRDGHAASVGVKDNFSIDINTEDNFKYQTESDSKFQVSTEK